MKTLSNHLGAEVRVGISGWTYPPWRGGAFYPPDLPQHRELEYASRQVRSIEINGTFYSLQRPESFRKWYEATPEGFVFSVKGTCFITHIKRLKDVEAPLANFLASGVLRLREKLGPFLWQFPPSFRYDRARLEAFFELLPRDTRVAAALSRRHDERLDGRAYTQTDAERPLRHAVEIRHASFETPEFIELLRAYDIGFVVADTAGKWPLAEDLTSDFVYVRLHGDEQLYVSGYTPEALKSWEQKIRAWAGGTSPVKPRLIAGHDGHHRPHRDVFVYFDNDVKVRAPYDAMTLAHSLGLGPAPDAPPLVHTISETPRTRWPSYGKKKSDPRKAVGRSKSRK